MRLRSDLMLFVVALVWGTTFAAQRVAAAWMGPMTYNGLRFLLGALLIGCAGLFFPAQPNPEAWPRRKAVFWVGLTGVLLFGASALQQIGLHYTTAGNAGFLTSLYVVLVPIVLLAIHHGDRWSVFRALRIAVAPADLPTLATWGAVVLAALGVFLLSGADLGAGKAFFDGSQQNFGDGLELIGALFWALHVILVGRLSRRMDVIPFMVGQFLVCGALNLAAGLAFEGGLTTGIVQAGWAILYSGILSIGLGFTLQALGQRHAPPSDAALILSLEAVFAALSGYILLGEQLSPQQALGCGLIFAAILLAQFNRLTLRVKATG